MSTGAAWRHKASARRKRQSAPGDTTQALGARDSYRLAEPGHRRAVRASFHHCLIASAWW